MANTIVQKDSPVDPRWKDMYRLGGMAAAASVALIVLGVVAYILWPYSPNAVSTADVYAQVLADRIGALMGMDLLYMIGNLTAIPLVLAMYVALHKVNESYALIAMVTGVMALLLLLAARPIVEVTAFADRYGVAATEAERNILLAAGEPLLALFTGTSYYVSYFLGTLSLLIYAFLMLEGKIFRKATAWVGIVTNAVAFGMFIPVIGLPLAFLSLAGLVIWDIQIARRFFQLARMASSARGIA
ncbi:MAG: DUF4386 family protein [Anaerolineales bacterium]|nr:DUF4386 family protein [Anaerolineales bacterium]